MRLLRLKTVAVFGCAAICGAFMRPGVSPQHYGRLFPQPTGRNGYEEFALAADLSNSSKPWQECERTGNESLDLMRRAMADPLNRRALDAVRAGLKKPITYPHADEDMTTLLPEMRDFRSVGRLFKVEMEVRFADGQTSGALDSLNDGLTFGRSVQAGGTTSGVVGLLVENTILKACSRHLGELTLHDCEKLIKIARTQLEQPDIQNSIVPKDRDIYVRTFAGHRTDALDLLTRLDPGPNAVASDRTDIAAVCDLLRHKPDYGPALMDDLAGLVRRQYDATLSELQKPVWERNYPVATDRESAAAKLLFAFCPRSYARFGDRFASERTLLQVLAVHAAVMRYRLTHKHLPQSLGQLNLGAIGTDVFTGDPLRFTPFGGEAYEISSAGPLDRSDGGRDRGGKRTPIAIRYPRSD